MTNHHVIEGATSTKVKFKGGISYDVEGLLAYSEAWDLAVENRKLWSRLREAGYRPAGGELPEGYGWPCWSGHTDELLTALFPIRN